MREAVAAIIEHNPDQHADLPKLVAALPDESVLWELMSEYHWGEGFAVPLAVVEHPRCDRGLALRLFWELDDTAQLYYYEEGNEADFREQYSTYGQIDPDAFNAELTYCSTLVGGLREQRFPRGSNRFDTGYFNLDDPSLTDRQRAIRAGHTRLKQKSFEDAFLQPEL